MYKITVVPEFFDAFRNLPKDIQKKISDFFSEFPKNPRKPGYHYEKLNGNVQGKVLHSARINDNFRIILYEDSKNQTFYILDVDCHDSVYDTFGRKSKIKNDSVNIRVESDAALLVKFKNFKKSLGLKPLLESISALDLKNLGVPESLIPFVKSISNMKNLEQLEGLVSENVLINLVMLAEGESVNDLKGRDNRIRTGLIFLINEKVLAPALKCPTLDQDIKESVQNTYNRIISKRAADGILDFFKDALDARRGKQIMDELHKNNLKAFEDIYEEVKKFAAQ
ncbi:MAG: hypothetical protein NC489_40775 [Ruminococcus flavefaciens]|nr:hypothetical protein [Ruminococcus flavefaciens]